jgi:hypothetical protein
MRIFAVDATLAMGIGSTETLVILAIALVLFRGIPRLDLFAYAHKYRGLRTRTRVSQPDRIDLILAATFILIAVAAVVLGILISTN